MKHREKASSDPLLLGNPFWRSRHSRISLNNLYEEGIARKKKMIRGRTRLFSKFES